tara:strand:+ start:8762 stop:10042 length:1281 start_codon:yes stop_codon:yes gene_type:complete
MATSHNIFSFRTLLAYLLFAMLLCGTQARSAGAMPSVDSVRIGDYPQKTRFVLELDKPVKFKAFTLSNPNRVVIELPEVSWRIKPRDVRRGKRIKGYRFGRYRSGQTRVVLNLKSPVKISKSFALGPNGKRGHRVVLDIVSVQSVSAGKSSKPQAVTKKPVSKKLAAKPVPKAKVAKIFAKPKKPTKKIQPRRPKLPRVIVIDPGHGGADPGARGRRGTQEKWLVLEQSFELKRQLLLTRRYRVIMTREKDVYIRLRKRIAIAQKAGADLFISIHADSIGNRHVRGGSVYTLSERASDKEAEALARRENKSDIIGGVDLNDQSQTVAKILIDLSQRLTKNNSVTLAKLLVGQLSKQTRMLRRKHRFAGFAVLKAPEIPSVLIEMGYLSNAKEEVLLRRSSHRRKIAGAIVRAIDRYFARQQAYKQP